MLATAHVLEQQALDEVLEQPFVSVPSRAIDWLEL
jgi:hypothetical protein